MPTALARVLSHNTCPTLSGFCRASDACKNAVDRFHSSCL
jgi:hypothetical protein